MWKAKLITWGISILMLCIALGVGIWYLSSSIGGTAISYSSLDKFLAAIGACPNGVCDISSANGCFLCGYIEKLFNVIGDSAEMFWDAMIENLWMVMAAGFAIYMFIQAYKVISESASDAAKLDGGEKNFDFKKWFDPTWKLGVRILIAGVFIGAIGFGGTAVLNVVANIIITPVMFIGSHLAMAASGVSSSAMCGSGIDAAGILGPVMQPFMCVIGNINSVILAGAAGGFSLMNYAAMGLGGGMFTWIAGLGLLIMFAVIGFNLVFKILDVIFMLVLVIIFLPLFIAAAAFEKVWPMMKDISANVVALIAKCAVKIVAVSLNAIIIYTMVSYTADEIFPGPIDGYSAITVPGISGNESPANLAPDSVESSISAAFSRCEAIATQNGGAEMNKQVFKDCFATEKMTIEATHPGAFDFMRDGWTFILAMIGIFFIYFYAVAPKIESILGLGKDDGGMFSYGTYVKDFAKTLWNIPKKIGEIVTGGMKK